MSRLNVSIISTAGLGNSLLTALALKKNQSLNNSNITVYVANDFAKSIFEYYFKNIYINVLRKKGKFLYLELLIKLIFSKNKKIIAEPNTSIIFINIIRIFFGNKIKFVQEKNYIPIENDYKKLFDLDENILNKAKFNYSTSDKFLIYPTVESFKKFSKKISENQLELIINYLKNKDLNFEIIIPQYEENQISSNFKKKYSSYILRVKKFEKFNKLIKFFSNYDVYIGGDTFYYHLMTKSLHKKSFVFFGSTNYLRFIFKNELTKYFYPDCPNYPTYDKYFSKVNFCKHCMTNYCIDKMNIKSLNIKI